ncbi:tetratricopeptide repeat protein [candidate division KSB1 bacterium]|nr:tetratricopeptide repeat protein [candidate division KSB1 bacterium]
MKQWYRMILPLMAAALIIGCGEKLTEDQLRANALDFENREQWQEAAQMYERLVKAYPKSKRAEETLYRLGVIYANNLKGFERSVETYRRLVKKYPESDYVIQSSFMIGYRYANDIKDLKRARQAYEDFMKKWPEHELAASVKWELEHLGEDISDIELQLSNPSQSDNPQQQ